MNQKELEAYNFGTFGLPDGAFNPIGAGQTLGILSLFVFSAVGAVAGTSLPMVFRILIDFISGAARRSDREADV